MQLVELVIDCSRNCLNAAIYGFLLCSDPTGILSRAVGLKGVVVWSIGRLNEVLIVSKREREREYIWAFHN